MFKKGVSVLLSVIILVLLAAAMFGIAYVYFLRFFESAASGIQIDYCYCDDGIVSVTIRNIGIYNISSLDVEQEQPGNDTAEDWEGILGPGRVLTYTDLCYGFEPRTCIYVISPPRGRIGRVRLVCVTPGTFSDPVICKNAEDAELCDGLDLIYGEGYKEACCSEHTFCC